eukprot:5936295-Amphidinium_carterae.1
MCVCPIRGQPRLTGSQERATTTTSKRMLRYTTMTVSRSLQHVTDEVENARSIALHTVPLWDNCRFRTSFWWDLYMAASD